MNSRRRPNIILVITDDQGAGDMGCQGNPILKSFAMDGLRLSIPLVAVPLRIRAEFNAPDGIGMGP